MKLQFFRPIGACSSCGNAVEMILHKRVLKLIESVFGLLRL